MAEAQRGTTWPASDRLYAGTTTLRAGPQYAYYGPEPAAAREQINILNIGAASYPREELWQRGIRTVGATTLRHVYRNGGAYVDRTAWVMARDATPADFDLIVLTDATAWDYVSALSNEMVARCIIASEQHTSDQPTAYGFLRNVTYSSARRAPLADAVERQLAGVETLWRDPQPDVEIHWGGFVPSTGEFWDRR